MKLKLKKSTIWKLPSVHQRESLLFKLNYVGTIWVSNDGKCDFSREQFCKVKYYVIAISILLIQNFCFLFIFKRLKVILIKRHCVMTEFLCNWALYVTGSTMRRTSFRVINELFWDWVFSIFDLNIGRSFKLFFCVISKCLYCTSYNIKTKVLRHRTQKFKTFLKNSVTVWKYTKSVTKIVNSKPREQRYH